MVNSYTINFYSPNLRPLASATEALDMHDTLRFTLKSLHIGNTKTSLCTDFKQEIKHKPINYTTLVKIKEFFGFGEAGYFNLVRTIDQIAVEALKAYEKDFDRLYKTLGPIFNVANQEDSRKIQEVAFIYDWRVKQIKKLENEFYKFYNPWVIFSLLLDSLLNFWKDIDLKNTLDKWSFVSFSFHNAYLREKIFLIAQDGKQELYLRYNDPRGQTLFIKNGNTLMEEVQFTIVPKTSFLIPRPSELSISRKPGKPSNFHANPPSEFFESVLKAIMSINHITRAFYVDNQLKRKTYELNTAPTNHQFVVLKNDPGIKYAMKMESVVPELECTYVPIAEILKIIQTTKANQS